MGMTEILDYGWFVLLLTVALGTAGMGTGLLVSYFVGHSAPLNLKWMWRILAVQILSLIFAGTVYIWHKQGPDCFDAALAAGLSPLTRKMALVWIAGVFLLVVKDGLQFLHLLFSLRAWPELEVKRLNELADQFSLKQVNVRVAPGLNSPFVTWAFGSIVVLPEDFDLDDPNVDAILAHELAHMRDCDVQWGYLELFLRRLLFFHPFSWWSQRSWHLVHEMAADAMAVKHLQVSPTTYGRGFLNLLSKEYASVNPPIVLWAVSSFSILKTRLEFLAAGAHESRWARAIASLALVAFFMIGLAEARALIRPSQTAGMCLQIRHEQFLEKLLQMQREPLVCKTEEK